MDLNDVEPVDNFQHETTSSASPYGGEECDGDTHSLDLNNVEPVDNIQHETTWSGSPVVGKECDGDTNISVSSLDLQGLNDDIFEFVPEEGYSPQTDDEGSSDGVNVDVSSSSSSDTSEYSINVDLHRDS